MENGKSVQKTKTITVTITEILSKDVQIKIPIDDDYRTAEDIAKNKYNKSEIVLTADDYDYTTFNAESEKDAEDVSKLPF